MSKLSYRASIDFLFNLETSAIKLGLDNTVDLLRAIGNPEESFQSIHIAGTNGKGSVACFLNSILYHNGVVAGLFTSPHLVDYRERIRKDGVAIPARDVSEIVSEVAGHVTRIGASYFEATTALAFEYFKRERVEVAVVEVGMGGRLDSTNVIRPLVTCITTIDFDHEKYLGRTLTKIAGEKAGIIKDGVPVVCGLMPERARVIVRDVARKHKSRIFQVGRHTALKPLKIDRDGSTFEYRGLARKRTLRIGLVGLHQIANAAVAVLTAEVLNEIGFRIEDRAIDEGLRHALWPGRLQVLKRRPLVLCDGAHNVSGARVLVRSLGQMGIAGTATVFGVLRDKNYERMLAVLAARTTSFVFTKPAYERALPVRQLKAAGRTLGLAFKAFPRVHDALEYALNHAEPCDTLLVCGSLYAVGEAMQFFGFKPHCVRLC
jgi:dihydrofolate synthase/folylpolyglutamate synthase